MGWVEFATRRIIVSVGILFAASIVVFSIVRLVPGDPALIILGQHATEQSVEELRRRLGLDVPVWQQYLEWIFGVLTGDWGRSLISDQSVYHLISIRFPRSLQLAIMAMVIALIISLPLGILAALNRNTRIDYAALFFSQFGVSIPSFLLGIVFIILFAQTLGLLPASGHMPLREDPVANIKHTIMPSLTLGIINAAIITRFIRAEMLDKLNNDYVRTARAFGHPNRRITNKYVLRNVMIPTLTVVGIQVGYMIGGIVIIEKVFAYPGLGRLLLDSLLRRDYPVIQLSILTLAATFIIINLIVDLLYGYLDPKLRV